MPNLIKKQEKPNPYIRRSINTGGIKFDRLSFGTLRRYQYYFGLDKRGPFLDKKEQLLEAVEEHFSNEFKVDPTQVIY